MMEYVPDVDGVSQEETPGGPALTVEQAIANLAGSDTGLRYYAAWWLGRFRVNEPAVVDALLVALEDETDRTELGGYPLRRNAARALGKIGDRRAVPGLLRCLESTDFYVRESAAQALGMLGDPIAIPPLLSLLDGGLAVAERVPGRPHLVQPCEAVMEALGHLAPHTEWTEQAIACIHPFSNHELERVQYAASRALYQLTGDSVYGDRLMQALQGSNVTLRRAALADLGAVGYLPAAEAIATAAAENSFKLFSLKGLLEYQVDSTQTAPSTDAIRIMTLMDGLL